ncbi:hypothetical protein COU62_00550 [Candidatus Pacearchaeota archaeon CG10_big_fil_rev_8_21_14_0_10_35_219]|nr:type II secretion system F family protein [Candidatus Pacearchaeota archaeon]OIO42696.1 MAG: hypothetical protein AUJ63_02175 [Candidatus Pacearchaeota archaeon CG1_02_35_32]PIO08280.1 MAG: hypothetical protein COU62_00550 [Candidatus Pacearchaeota archaeon CG10_big_fil_rev_8_21_14_0_10_35_219]PIY81881.1 MAG: hypothetical protein COY79_00290 [Candidatus Pacearchaeota archaeon CG_4_10_14_0_8_um_filter_35_169]PIZ79378.1 MAG: hypothetical protein COY00_04345 [Candidatus Pacearchaeota archaeon C
MINLKKYLTKLKFRKRRKGEKPKRLPIILPPIIAILISATIGLIYWSFTGFIISFFAFLIVSYLYTIIRAKLKEVNKIKKMEKAFPDFIQLMASNLRAGMTIDRAMIMSSRKEFAPLDSEITILGKDIITGKEITVALNNMAERIKSDKITKTVKLVTSGIRSGGNLAVLLEKTSANLREKEFVEKRAASNVLMYVIFIFIAVAFGAPLLFGLSTVLVEVLTSLLANVPEVNANLNVPFTLTKVSVSSTFIFYFALIFMTVTDILAALVLGLVSKGEEREGLKYILPLVASSLIIFLLVKNLLGRYFIDFLA